MIHIMRKFLYLWLMLALPVWAGKYPVITSVRTEYYGKSNYIYKWRYYITTKIMEIGPAADMVYPASLFIVLAHKHKEKTDDPITDTGEATVSRSTDGHSTVGQLAIDLYNNSGQSAPYVLHESREPSPAVDECVGYFVTTQIDYSPWESTIRPAGCLVIPPVDQLCKILTPEIVFDHGTISLKDAENNSQSAPVSVQCTTPMAVNFSLINGEQYIYLDEGKAQITVNDLPLNSSINLPSGDSTVTVKDLLTGITHEGLHTGSSVLVMMPY